MTSGARTHFRTLNDVVQSRAQTIGDEKGYTFLASARGDGTTLSYRALDRRARALAAALQDRLASGSRTLLLCPPSLDYVVGFFGSLYAGMTAVPVYPPTKPRDYGRLLAIAEDAEATAIITMSAGVQDVEAWLERTSRAAGISVFAVDAIGDTGADDWKQPDTTGDSLALLQYTSGSTGQPKGVMVTHANLLHNLRQVEDGFGHDEDTCVVSWLPPYHDMGLIGTILQPVYCGGRVYLMPPMSFIKDPMRWLHVVSRFGATTSGAPDFAYAFCSARASAEDLAALDLSRWTVAFNGAEVVREATIDRFAEVFGPCGFRRNAFYPCYGLAEATLLVSGGDKLAGVEVDEVDATELMRGRLKRGGAEKGRRVVSCGVPRGVEVRIVDPATCAPCPEDAVGEIWVRGPSVTAGYWRKPDETERIFGAWLSSGEDDGGPYLRTGDLGYLHDGELFITGREKDLIIVNGRNHYPTDIEATVSRCDSRFRPMGCAAISVFDDDREKVVVVQEIERKAAAEPSWEETCSRVRAEIAAEHGIHADTIILIKAGALPKTTSGKVQRYSVRAQLLAGEFDEIARSSAPPPSLVDAGVEPWDAGGSRAELAQTLWRMIANASGLSPAALEAGKSFHDLGLDSIAIVRLAGAIEKAIGKTVSPALFYSRPTVGSLVEALTTGIAVVAEQPIEEPDEPIAIIGIGCRFPGKTDDVDRFWYLIRNEGVAIDDVPAGRWDVDAYFDPDPNRPGTMYTKRMASIDGVDLFEPEFFKISPREAEDLDPQQRLLLEVTWEALENAGVAPNSLKGSQTGVFVGISSSDFGRITMSVERVNAYSGTGSAASTASGRVSFCLGLRGPSVSVDTACSSSLAAVHFACQSLRSGESTMAIAAGVNLILSPENSIALCKLRALSPSGACQVFDDNADGYVRGEGCGVVVLKRLSDAQRDGDPVWATISSSAMNHDGQSNGLTAPSGEAQQLVITRALRRAGVQPDDVAYVEAHGTGTRLGDPIELEALGSVFGPPAMARPPLLVGSLKSNLGHLEAAAGIASLIKAALIVHHREIPSNRTPTKKNTQVRWDTLGVDVPHISTPLSIERRLVGVSSFGLSGTNVHAILEPATRVEHRHELDSPPYLLVLSARTSGSLRALADRYAHFLDCHPDTELADMCITAAAGRCHFEHRLAIMASDHEAFGEALKRFASDNLELSRPDVQVWHGVTVSSDRIIPVIPDQAPALDLVERLAQADTQFRSALDECERILRSVVGCSLRELWEQRRDQTGLARNRLAAMSVSFALWTMLKAHGIRTSSIAGLELTGAAYPWLNDAAALERAFATEAKGSPEMLSPAEDVDSAGPGQRLELTISPRAADARGCLLGVLAHAYVSGADLHFESCMGARAGRVLRLPTYAFDRRSFWPRVSTSPSVARPSPIGLSQLAAADLDTPLELFESSTSLDSDAWLADHRVNGAAVLPATAYLWLAQRAGTRARHDIALEIHAPLVLGASPTRIQVIVDGRSERAAPATSFSVFSRPGDGSQEWQRHASGTFVAATGEAAPARRSLVELRALCTSSENVPAFYARLEAAGLGYGSVFRTVREAWTSDDEALGHIAGTHERLAGGSFPPEILDGALHLLAAPRSIQEQGNLFLPVAVRRYRQLRPYAGGDLWVHAKLQHRSDSELEGDITLMDETGEIVGELAGVRGKRAHAIALDGERAEQSAAPSAEWLPSLVHASRPERREFFIERLTELIRESLRLPAEHTFTPQTDFADLGVDSLAAVEVTEHIAVAAGISVPTSVIFDVFCLDDLVDQVLELFEEVHPEAIPANTHLEARDPHARG